MPQTENHHSSPPDELMGGWLEEITRLARESLPIDITLHVESTDRLFGIWGPLSHQTLKTKTKASEVICNAISRDRWDLVKLLRDRGAPLGSVEFMRVCPHTTNSSRLKMMLKVLDNMAPDEDLSRVIETDTVIRFIAHSFSSPANKHTKAFHEAIAKRINHVEDIGAHYYKKLFNALLNCPGMDGIDWFLNITQFPIRIAPYFWGAEWMGQDAVTMKKAINALENAGFDFNISDSRHQPFIFSVVENIFSLNDVASFSTSEIVQLFPRNHGINYHHVRQNKYADVQSILDIINKSYLVRPEVAQKVFQALMQNRFDPELIISKQTETRTYPFLQLYLNQRKEEKALRWETAKTKVEHLQQTEPSATIQAPSFPHPHKKRRH